MVEPDASNPWEFYAQARTETPVVYHPGLNAWLITRYDTILAVTADPNTFASQGSLPFLLEQPPPVNEVLQKRPQPLSASIVASDPPDHQWRRDIWQRAMHGTRINQFRGEMRSIANKLIDTALDKGSLDFVTDFAQPFVHSVIGALLGVPEQDRHVAWARAMDFLNLGNPLATMDERVAAAERDVEFDSYVLDLIHEYRQNPGHDLMSTMATMDDLPGTPMSDGDLLMMFRTFYGAGIDTSRDALTGTAWELLANHHWREAITTPGLIPHAIEERLRRAGPHRNLMRTTTTDVTLDGVNIPAGSSVLLMFPAAGRDPERFPDPDTFDPHRPNKREHLAFGAGLHLCVGAHLARTEARVALEVATQRLPHAQLPDGYEPTYAGDLFFYGLTELPITWR